ncbi:uncharacterized protein LOC128867510 isoform X2 [Anastrepha ludens]|uniref:uncharacterized protein LOC128867510 isoform X2 n=1 Tax=Anastrepha ludens TaxID=28586 RepID=UPI0023AED160|nr:uncharacterized protein LOC128867510 isoform X2 [Anastrepha ludens]
MQFKVALICLLGVAAVNAFGEFDCEEFPARKTDPLAPTPTVRVCGAGEYEDIPKILRLLLGIEKPEPAAGGKFSNGIDENAPYSNEPYWQSKNPVTYAEEEQFAPAAPRPYPYEVINRAFPAEDNQFDFQSLVAHNKPQHQQKLESIVSDVSAVKQSVSDLESNLSAIAKSLLQDHKTEKSEMNINIIFKLDPILEQMLKGLLQLDEKPEVDINKPTDQELLETLHRMDMRYAPFL